MAREYSKLTLSNVTSQGVSVDLSYLFPSTSMIWSLTWIRPSRSAAPAGVMVLMKIPSCKKKREPNDYQPNFVPDGDSGHYLFQAGVSTNPHTDDRQAQPETKKSNDLIRLRQNAINVQYFVGSYPSDPLLRATGKVSIFSTLFSSSYSAEAATGSTSSFRRSYSSTEKVEYCRIGPAKKIDKLKNLKKEKITVFDLR